MVQRKQETYAYICVYPSSELACLDSTQPLKEQNCCRRPWQLSTRSDYFQFNSIWSQVSGASLVISVPAPEELKLNNYLQLLPDHVCTQKTPWHLRCGRIYWLICSFIHLFVQAKYRQVGRSYYSGLFIFFIINIHKSTFAGQLANPLLPLKDLRASADGAAGAEQHVVKFRHVILQGNTAIEYQLHPSVPLSVCLSLSLYVCYIYIQYMIIYDHIWIPNVWKQAGGKGIGM